MTTASSSGSITSTVNEHEKFRTYTFALNEMWKADPNTETQRRYNDFVRMERYNKLKWIAFVEANPQIEWCRQLAVATVTVTLEGKA